MRAITIHELPIANYGKEAVDYVAIQNTDGLIKKVDLSEETKLAADLGDMFNKFASLPEFHPDDINDFRFHIHALQNIIASRIAVKVGQYKLTQTKT